MVNCSVAHLFDHPPPFFFFFFKAFFSRPLVSLLIWAPGPKCLGVKTSPVGGGAVFQVLSCPFLSRLLPFSPRTREPGPAASPEPCLRHPRPLRGKERQMGVWLVLSRGPRESPNLVQRPNHRRGSRVPSGKDSSL